MNVGHFKCQLSADSSAGGGVGAALTFAYTFPHASRGGAKDTRTVVFPSFLVVDVDMVGKCLGQHELNQPSIYLIQPRNKTEDRRWTRVRSSTNPLRRGRRRPHPKLVAVSSEDFAPTSCGRGGNSSLFLRGRRCPSGSSTRRMGSRLNPRVLGESLDIFIGPSP